MLALSFHIYCNMNYTLLSGNAVMQIVYSSGVNTEIGRHQSSIWLWQNFAHVNQYLLTYYFSFWKKKVDEMLDFLFFITSSTVYWKMGNKIKDHQALKITSVQNLDEGIDNNYKVSSEMAKSIRITRIHYFSRLVYGHGKNL